MHPALQRLVEAQASYELAQKTLTEAEELRRNCALRLAEIDDREERTESAVWAYGKFVKGLSLALAEAVTGLPGKKGQSRFLVLAGCREEQRKGHTQHNVDTVLYEPEPVTEWPPLTPIEREVVASHVKHRQPYFIDCGLGWTVFSATLEPEEAEAFLIDPTSALAANCGISREMFVEWLSSSGHIPCEGHYGNGRACASRVAGVRGQLSLDEWIPARERGGYCKRHGGE